MSQITVLGLGAMGTSIAKTLLAAGHEVTVWNRSPERDGELLQRGARPAVTVAEALARSPVAVVCVLDAAAVREVLARAPDALQQKCLVNLTNGTPADALELSRWTASLGAQYLDGAIMVTPELLGTPEAFVLYSGDGEAFRGHLPALSALGRPHYLGDDPSLAAVQDLAFLSAMFGMFGGYLHAAALLRSKGFRTAEVTPAIVAVLSSMLGLLPETAAQIDSGHYPAPTSNNRMMAAALENIVTGSEQQGVRSDLMRPLLALFERAVAGGSAHLDIAALVPLFSTRAAC